MFYDPHLRDCHVLNERSASSTAFGVCTLSKRVFSGIILTLGAVQLIESIAMGLPLSFFPNYVIGLGATVASIGIFTSSFMLSSAIMAPRMGGLSDRYGRKKVMLVGIVGDILFGFATGLAPGWEWLLLIRFINGAVSGAAMLSAEALLMDSVEPNVRGEASGFLMAASMIGRNVGPLIGGTIQWLSLNNFGLSLLNSYRVPYFVDAGFAVLAFCLVYLFIKEPEKQSITDQERLGGHKFKLTFTRSLKVLFVDGFIKGMSVGFIMPIMVLFYNDKFSMDAMGIGMIMSISGFIGLFASWIAGRMADRMGRKPLIGFGTYLSQIFGFILPLTQDVTQAGVALSVRSLGFNMSMPAFRALRADVTPPEARGKVFGYFMTAFTAGDVIGPIISAWLYDFYRSQTFLVLGGEIQGIGIPFFINAILGVFSTTLVMLFVREPKPEERASRMAVAPLGSE
jgi:DHA1 family multidrug resistance protein-like MFS transporter